MIGEPYSATDNVPMEWPRGHKRSSMRTQLSDAQSKRLLKDLVKFATVCVLDLENTMEPGEIVEEWLNMTFSKNKLEVDYE